MEKLILNDGTVIENSHVLLSKNVLWFYLTGVTFDRAYELMSNTFRTAVITQDAYGTETVYEGYTDLFCLRREDDGMITGGLNHA